VTEMEKIIARQKAREAAKAAPRQPVDYDAITAEVVEWARQRDQAIADREGLSLEEFRTRRAWRETEEQRRSGRNSVGLS
jgi:biotin carboxylase